MNLINLVRGLLNLRKKLDVKILPSQGLFYKDNFEIFIKKADSDDIKEYEYNYMRNDLMSVIVKLKKVVEKNCTFSSGYFFSDIKSIDVIFIFLEIVKLTKGKSITLSYFNDEVGKDDFIEFNSNHFNYFNLTNDIMKYYDNQNKLFDISGYKFTLPSIGVENCITNFLISMSNHPDAMRYNEYSYDFTFFLSDKKLINFSEIENLIGIFNFDIDDAEKKKIKKIVKLFQPIQKYSLRKGNRVIDLNSKINLEEIWK